MTEKFTLEDLFIKIIPGGVLIGVLYFLYSEQITFKFEKGLDFFYTFLFFTFSFLAGEIIQTIAHLLEWVINSFFKFYKPSEIFLYQDNPVLKNEHIRKRIIKHLAIETNEQDLFDKKYSDLPLWRNREKQSKAQSFFWKLYSEVSSDAEIKTFNRSYLLVRAITFLSLGLSIVLFCKALHVIGIIGIALFIIFLWRARGMARMLVFKTVMLNLKSKG